jgi:hypothetical protein
MISDGLLDGWNASQSVESPLGRKSHKTEVAKLAQWPRTEPMPVVWGSARSPQPHFGWPLPSCRLPIVPVSEYQNGLLWDLWRLFHLLRCVC